MSQHDFAIKNARGFTSNSGMESRRRSSFMACQVADLEITITSDTPNGSERDIKLYTLLPLCCSPGECCSNGCSQYLSRTTSIFNQDPNWWAVSRGQVAYVQGYKGCTSLLCLLISHRRSKRDTTLLAVPWQREVPLRKNPNLVKDPRLQNSTIMQQILVGILLLQERISVF